MPMVFVKTTYLFQKNPSFCIAKPLCSELVPSQTATHVRQTSKRSPSSQHTHLVLSSWIDRCRWHLLATHALCLVDNHNASRRIG